MTDRLCEVCGTVIAGRRADARFCGSACRARYRRGERAVGVHNRSQGLLEPGSTATSLHDWLAERSLLEHPLASAALAVAERLDARVDGAAGMAAALRQLTLTMESFGGVAPARDDFLSLLRIQVDAKRAGIPSPGWTGDDIHRLIEWREEQAARLRGGRSA